MVTVQIVSVPLQAPPDHPVKVYPLSAAAVNLTVPPASKVAVQAEPQSILAVAALTLPEPTMAIVSEYLAAMLEVPDVVPVLVDPVESCDPSV